MARKKQELTALEQAELQLKAAKRLLTARKAQDNLLDFVRMMMPDPEDPDNTDRSRYAIARHHEVFAAALEAVERGEIPRLIITVPPRHGKSQLASKAFPAWFMGRDPYRQMIVASYSSTMAEDFGREVRQYMQSPTYQQIFPNCQLRKGGASSDRIQTEQGGIGVFVGAGGALTGRGADVLLIDDPVKDREDADSVTMRNKLWGWFTDVAMTRLMGGMGRVVIIMTRWHEDDLVGRLTDPNNQYYNADEAKQWKIIHFTALAEDGDIMGREKDEPLWPERVTKEFLSSQRRINPRGFAALYQGRPAPEEGDFFKREWLATYQPSDLPRNLRIYCASDHAVSTAQDRDPTVLMAAGVDEQDNIWILPDVWWRREETDNVVDAMLEMMARHKPLIWWAERGHISKSIGPFLRKRMQEEQIYCAIDEVVPVKDKQTRAQAIRGRMAMGKVRFPGFAPWWEAARHQMLTFPSGKHDDFCLSGDSMVTMADRSEKPISEVVAGEFVWTPAGSRKVTASAMTSQSSEVFRVTFSNGRSITGTGNHPIAVTSGGFVNIDKLTCMTEVVGYCQTWPNEEHQQQTLSSTGNTDTGGTQIQSTNTTVNTITAQSRDGGSCTDTFGKIITGLKSLMDTKFITSTETVLTMTSQTLRLFLERIIARFICEKDTLPSRTGRGLEKSGTSHLLGTDLKREGLGTAKMQFKHGRKERRSHLIACAAEKLDSPISQAKRPTVTIHAAPVTVEEVQILPTKIPVYNLTVDGEHVFLANGILTHNCDTLAYIGLGLGRMTTATSPVRKKAEPTVGSLAWVKHRAGIEARYKAQAKTIAGF